MIKVGCYWINVEEISFIATDLERFQLNDSCKIDIKLFDTYIHFKLGGGLFVTKGEAETLLKYLENTRKA